ncbi:hypothetical protein BN1013_00557 [Candidatus Rubidus massiliensis]|nr:hypothetical protein BN1013_00557 [Candidatus Rubidus massiliensis]
MNIFLSKRKLLFLLLLLLANFFILAFYLPHYLVEHNIKNFVKQQFKGDFKYKSLKKANNEWIFTQTNIINKKKGINFVAPQIIVNYSWSLFNLKADISIKVMDALLKHDGSITSIQDLDFSNKRKSKWFKTAQNVEFVKGKIDLGHHLIEFDATYKKNEKENWGYIHFKQDNELGLISWIEKGFEKDLILKCQNIQMRHFSTFFVLDRLSAKNLIIKEGILNGEFTISSKNLLCNARVDRLKFFKGNSAEITVEEFTIKNIDKNRYDFQASGGSCGTIDQIFCHSVNVDGTIAVQAIKNSFSFNLILNKATGKNIFGDFTSKGEFDFKEKKLKGNIFTNFCNCNCIITYDEQWQVRADGNPYEIISLSTKNDDRFNFLKNSKFTLNSFLTDQNDFLSFKGQASFQVDDHISNLDFQFSKIEPSVSIKSLPKIVASLEGEFVLTKAPSQILQFLLPETNYTCTELNLRGKLKDSIIHCQYNVDDFILSNKNFFFNGDIEFLSKWDIAQGICSYTGSLRQGTFTENNENLFLSKISSHFFLENNLIVLKNLEFVKDNIELKGEAEIYLNLDNKAANIINLNIFPLSFRLSEIISILPEISFSNSLNNFDAVIIFKQPINLKVSIQQDRWQLIDFKARGEIRDGAFKKTFTNLNIEKFTCQFWYDYGNNVIELNTIEGLIETNNSLVKEKYALGGDKLIISKIKDKHFGTLDFWIGTKKKDILRLKAQILELSDNKFEITFDPIKTHIDTITPKSKPIIYSIKNGIESLELAIPITLSKISAETKQLFRLIENSTISRINAFLSTFDLNGNLDLFFSYQKEKPLKLVIESSNFKVGEYDEKNIIVQLDIHNSNIEIKKCHFDKWQMISNIVLKNSILMIDSLHLFFEREPFFLFAGEIQLSTLKTTIQSFFIKSQFIQKILAKKLAFDGTIMGSGVIEQQLENQPNFQLRLEGSIEPKLSNSLEINPDKFSYNLFIKNMASYDLKGLLKLSNLNFNSQLFPISLLEPKIEFTKENFKLHSICKFLNTTYDLNIQSSCRDGLKGSGNLSNSIDQEATFLWDLDNHYIPILECKGFIQNITFDLQNSKSSYSLCGIIKGNLRNFSEIAKRNDNPFPNFTDGVFLYNGILNFDKATPIKLNGKLFLDRVQIEKNYLKSIQANLELNDKTATLSKVELIDTNCHLIIPYLTINFKPEEIIYNIPLVNIDYFNSDLLKHTFINELENKNIFIKNSLIKNIIANGKKFWSTFTADSLVHFSYKSKHLTSPLICKPKEELKRNGLSLHSIQSLKGTIECEIKNQKIEFKKLTKFFSSNKEVKFSLANQCTSYIDFNGQLNLHFKIKQTNLLFKFGDLFMLKLNGYIDKPVYSIQKIP